MNNEAMSVKGLFAVVLLTLIVLGLGGYGGYWVSQQTKDKEIKQATTRAADKAKSEAEKKQAATPLRPKTNTDQTCNADELSLSVATGDAAAGTVAYNLFLTNAGQRSCSLSGFPGVSLVNDNGNQIGQSADRAVSYINKKVNLAPGAKTEIIVGLGNAANFTAGQCKPGATKFRVFPPNDTGYLSAATSVGTWCPGFTTSPVMSIS